MKSICRACAALLLLATASYSADLPVEPVFPPPAAERFDWTGFYVGGHVGWGWDEADRDCTRDTTGEFACFLNDRLDISSDGFVGGGQIGYLHQLPSSIVLGVDVSGSWADINGEKSDSVGLRNSTEFDWLLLAQARLGWAVDRWMLFVQGGYAGADVNAEYFNGADPQSDSNWHNGWTLGLGTLFKATENVSIGMEYSYIDLGRERYNLSPCSGCGGVTRRADIENQTHVAKITANWHFGWPR